VGREGGLLQRRALHAAGICQRPVGLPARRDHVHRGLLEEQADQLRARLHREHRQPVRPRALRRPLEQAPCLRQVAPPPGDAAGQGVRVGGRPQLARGLEAGPRVHDRLRRLVEASERQQAHPAVVVRPREARAPPIGLRPRDDRVVVHERRRVLAHAGQRHAGVHPGLVGQCSILEGLRRAHHPVEPDHRALRLIEDVVDGADDVLEPGEEAGGIGGLGLYGERQGHGERVQRGPALGQQRGLEGERVHADPAPGRPLRRSRQRRLDAAPGLRGVAAERPLRGLERGLCRGQSGSVHPRLRPAGAYSIVPRR
jgi:hypothetical protein